MLFAQQHTIVDLVTLDHAAHFKTALGRRTSLPLTFDADDFQPIRSVVALEFLQVRNGLHAWHAPGAPEIEQHKLAMMLAEFPWLSVEVVQGEIHQSASREVA